MDGDSLLGLKMWNIGENRSEDQIEVPSQKKLLHIQDVKVYNDLCNDLQTQGDVLGKAWLRSGATKGSGSWLLGTAYGAPPILRLSEQHFKVNLLLRLLLPPHWVQGPVMVRCGSCNNTGNSGDMDPRVHGLNCGAMSQVRTRRHDDIRNALKDLIAYIWRDAVVELETIIDPQHNQLRSDIMVKLGARVWYLDVSVVNPSSMKHARRNGDANQASKHAAHDKWKKYQTSIRRQNLPDDSFIPFIIEATGRFGEEASAFLKLLSDVSLTAKGRVSFFRNHCRVLVARGNGVVADTYMKRSRLLDYHPSNTTEPATQPDIDSDVD